MNDRRFFARGLSLATALALLSGCGGGGGGTTPSVSTTPTPVQSTQSLVVTGGTVLAGSVAGLDASFVYVGGASAGTNITTTSQVTAPSGEPAPSSVQRQTQTITGAVPFFYVIVTVNQSVPTSIFTSETLTITSQPATASYYVEIDDLSLSPAKLTTIPGTPNGSTVTFFNANGSGSNNVTSLVPDTTYVFQFYYIPAGTPTPTPTSSSNSSTAYTCPTSDSAASVARSAAVAGADATKRLVFRAPSAAAATSGLLAVAYDRSTARSQASAIASREQSAGATLVKSFDFPHSSIVSHLLAVPPAQAQSVTATLKAQAGVLSVGSVARRNLATVSGPYWTGDPYFDGFTAAQNIQADNSQPSTNETAGEPYNESANVPGQWDMHAIGLGQAFEYSQSGNGSSVTPNQNALGSSSVKIAIIDTGEDPNHPELASKIVYQRCFITNLAGTSQSTSDFSMDPMGHGTDVSGIAAADTGNNFGFAGAGGKVVIYAYRVFPTPDDNCANSTTSDPQCEVDTPDIASAIEDAIAQGVNVISMSLGGSTCGTGSSYAPNGDSDPYFEGPAVAEAIAANIVVVAAAGNSGTPGVEAPACDTGVIAVGASALADGVENGTNDLGSASSPVEYVASYSDYGSPGASPNSPSAWGIVAPGGDPNSGSDLGNSPDDLHWIENIWTTTPYQAYSGDQNFEGECTDDYPNSNGTTAPVDCRTLIAGTSMATPHVAGAAALILSVNASYQSPSAMKSLLCSTADNIGSSYEGCGRLNVYRAMATALGDANLPTGNGPW